MGLDGVRWTGGGGGEPKHIPGSCFPTITRSCDGGVLSPHRDIVLTLAHNIASSFIVAELLPFSLFCVGLRYPPEVETPGHWAALTH